MTLPAPTNPQPLREPGTSPLRRYHRILQRDPWLLIGVGLIQAYVWRFHILAPPLEKVRLSAFLTVGSWLYLATSANWRQLALTIRIPFIASYLLLLTWAFIGHPFGLSPGNSWTNLREIHLPNLTFL